MNKVIAIVVAVIIIAGGAWALTKGNNSSSGNASNGSQNSSSNSSSSSTTNSSSNTSPVATDKVAIQNFAFSPSDITVKKGTKVTWTNQDTVAHTVTENDGKNGPSAPPMKQGDSYSFTFNEVGTFHYHCSFHSDMTGTVTVTD